MSANVTTTGRSLWANALVKLRRDWTAMLCLAVIVVYAVIALAGPLFLSRWESSYDYEQRNLPPSDPGREERQIARLRKLAEEANLDPEFSEKFLRFIIQEVIRHHEQAKAGG